MSKTTDAIAAADAATIETRNQRGWTPEQVRQWTPEQLRAMNPEPEPPRPFTLGNTEQFHAEWQDLMRTLETVLSLAHYRVPLKAAYHEAINVAKYHLTQLDTQRHK